MRSKVTALVKKSRKAGKKALKLTKELQEQLYLFRMDNQHLLDLLFFVFAIAVIFRVLAYIIL